MAPKATDDTELDAPVPGTPKSPEAAARLAKFDKINELPLILAAVLPLVLGFGDSDSLVVGLVFVLSWLVFLADFVVHYRLTNHYLRTRRGKFDLVVVILTAPWFFIPGFSESRFVVVVRFARIVRLLFASRAARHLFQRLGRAAIVAVVMVFMCAYVAYDAEHAVNPQFATYTDSLWWGISTLTTVGYGDIVPITGVGRWAGVVLMVTGVGIIGALAGSLASFLRLDRSKDDASTPTGSGDPAAEPELTAGQLAQTVASLRVQLADLDRQLATLQIASGDEARGAPS